MSVRYDVICIGAGSGGLSVALTAVELGLRVLIIDKEESNFGGECLHSGCVPSKALLHASRTNKDFAAAKKYYQSVQVKIFNRENVTSLRKRGIDVVVGNARFEGRNTVSVGDCQYLARKIVIATGSVARKLDVANHGKVPLVTHHDVFEINEPRHLGIIGGGPVGCEMAQAFSNLGIKVTLVERGERLLPRDEIFAGNIITRKLRDNGVTVCLRSELKEIDYGNRMHLYRNSKSKIEEKITESITHLLVAVGSERDFANLDLAAAGIAVNDSGMPVLKNYVYTTNPDVVLVGDAAGGPQFSHTAEEHARALIKNWLMPFIRFNPRLLTVPWVTYTDFEVAKFGLSPDVIKQKFTVWRVIEGDFATDDRAVIDNYSDGQYKIYVAKRLFRERIVGGTVVAPGASEMVQELILAAEQRLPLSSISGKFYAYPTKSQTWQRVLLQDQASRMIKSISKRIITRWFRIKNYTNG
jgi:pyruvate/2-oxoglutarate dehydrogenase complex dihydrolipoamide dehydrogenase (E3) component